MQRAFSYMLMALMALLAILFAVNNRQTAEISLAPLPWQLDMPVYLLVMLSLIAGVLLGGLANWLAAGKQRKELRHTRRELKKQQLPQSRD